MADNISKSKFDFLGNELQYDCMGCAIANRNIKIPGGIIYEREYAILGAGPEALKKVLISLDH